MTLELIPIDRISGPDLYALMDSHNLITLGMAVGPGRLIQVANGSDFYLWHEDGEPIATQVETRNAEPGILDIALFPEDRTASKRLWNDFRAIGFALRKRWFEEQKFNRVQATVPASRVNTERMLRALGFVEETRKNSGIRDYFTFLNGHRENANIWGLLASDPASRDRVEIAYEYVET